MKVPIQKSQRSPKSKHEKLKSARPLTERRKSLLKIKALVHRDPSAYGGDLYSLRNNRRRPRPLSLRHSMHLVLRSTQARGAQSFRNPKIKRAIEIALNKFAQRHKVKIITWANVGNHLHFHFRIEDRPTYKSFIRALTASIAMAATKISRWNQKNKNTPRFWDKRPFTRAVRGNNYFKTLNEYIWINDLEGRGQKRSLARFFVELTNAKIFDRKNPHLRP